jgi:ABC-type ATPase involved in cell division
VLEEIMRVLRVLEWSGGHYYLTGESGLGKKTILKLCLLLCDKELA